MGKSCEYALAILQGKMTLADVPSRYKAKVSNTLTDSAKLLEYAKLKQWEIIKEKRDSLESGGCPFMDSVLDSDVRSVTKLNVLVDATKIAGEDFTIVWTMQDGTSKLLTYNDILSIPIALAQWSNTLHKKARVYYERIYAAKTIDEVLEVEWEGTV